MSDAWRFDQAAATWDAEERRILLAWGVTEAIVTRCGLPADLDLEDGTFHEDARGVAHLGLDRGRIAALLVGAGFVDVAVETATVTRKAERSYPVFLATGREAEAVLPAAPAVAAGGARERPHQGEP